MTKLVCLQDIFLKNSFVYDPEQKQCLTKMILYTNNP